MAELPFHLRTIEPLPGALDILRYFGELDTETADADDICDALDLSDRRFSKAIRRLVTKGYLMMDGDMIYRLTDQGQDAVGELSTYDEATGGGLQAIPRSEPEPETTTTTVTRRMIAAVPQMLVTGQRASVVVGFQPGEGETELAVRLSVINGQPESPEDLVFSLQSGSVHQAVEIIPGSYDKVRIRMQAVQLGPNPDDYNPAGGMYVDVPVTNQSNNDHQITAFGTDVTLIQ